MSVSVTAGGWWQPMMGEDSSTKVSPDGAHESRAVDDFPALPDTPPSQLNRRPRVCIATSDLLGPIRNGGVGTASAVLAEVLASAGHHVTLLYAGPYEQGDAHQWQVHFQQRQIAFVSLSASPITLEASITFRRRTGLTNGSSATPVRRVQFPDIGGLGFYSMQAKRLGLAFMDTVSGCRAAQPYAVAPARKSRADRRRAGSRRSNIWNGVRSSGPMRWSHRAGICWTG